MFVHRSDAISAVSGKCFRAFRAFLTFPARTFVHFARVFATLYILSQLRHLLSRILCTPSLFQASRSTLLSRKATYFQTAKLQNKCQLQPRLPPLNRVHTAKNPNSLCETTCFLHNCLFFHAFSHTFFVPSNFSYANIIFPHANT